VTALTTANTAIAERTAPELIFIMSITLRSEVLLSKGVATIERTELITRGSRCAFRRGGEFRRR